MQLHIICEFTNHNALVKLAKLNNKMNLYLKEKILKL